MSFQQPQAKGRGLCVRHIFIDNKPCPFLLLCMSCTQPCSWRSSAHPQRCRQTTPSRQDSRSVFERLLPGKTFPGRSRSGTPEGTGVAVAGDRGQQCFTVVGGHGQELSRRTKAEVVNEDVSTRARPLAWGCWNNMSVQQRQAAGRGLCGTSSLTTSALVIRPLHKADDSEAAAAPPRNGCSLGTPSPVVQGL